MRLLGYPAFLMTTRKQKKEALVRFSFVVLFSIFPLFLISFLNQIATDGLGFFEAVGRYTQAGQIYFYVGAIIGSAFLLVRDNFRVRGGGRRKLSGGEELMQTERAWLTLYIVLVAVSATIILAVYHLGAEKNNNLIYISSVLIYLFSLYVWFVDILYSQIDLEEGDAEHEQDEMSGSQSKIGAALAGMAMGEDK